MAWPFRRRRRPKSLVLQGQHLLCAQPESRVRYVQGKYLLWRGRLQPHALSNEYAIRINYALRRRPHVFVDSPPLRSRGEERIPHTFAENELCLFWWVRRRSVSGRSEPQLVRRCGRVKGNCYPCRISPLTWHIRGLKRRVGTIPGGGAEIVSLLLSKEWSRTSRRWLRHLGRSW